MAYDNTLYNLDDELIGIIDSTPPGASGYDQYAPYNPHYQIEMGKAHIYFHPGKFPLAMMYSRGTDANITHLLKLMTTVAPMHPDLYGVYNSMSRMILSRLMLRSGTIWMLGRVLLSARGAVIQKEGYGETGSSLGE